MGAESWASLLVELVPQRNVLSPCHLAGLSELPEQEEVPESRDPGAGDQLHGGCLLAFPVSAVGHGVWFWTGLGFIAVLAIVRIMCACGVLIV